MNLVNGDWLRRPPAWSEALLLALTGIVLGVGLCQLKPLASLLAAAGIFLVVTLVSFRGAASAITGFRGSSLPSASCHVRWPGPGFHTRDRLRFSSSAFPATRPWAHPSVKAASAKFGWCAMPSDNCRHSRKSNARNSAMPVLRLRVSRHQKLQAAFPTSIPACCTLITSTAMTRPVTFTTSWNSATR